jgi:hypothetical protein
MEKQRETERDGESGYEILKLLLFLKGPMQTILSQYQIISG